ncbi:hypothetical protein V6N13_122168 [Hibiscus sabdariffa]
MSLWSRGLNKVKEVVAEVNVDILTRCSVRGGVGTLFRIRIWCGIWDWQRYRGFTLCGSQVQRVPIHAWSSWNCVMLALQAPCETSAQLAFLLHQLEEQGDVGVSLGDFEASRRKLQGNLWRLLKYRASILVPEVTYAMNAFLTAVSYDTLKAVVWLDRLGLASQNSMEVPLKVEEIPGLFKSIMGPKNWVQMDIP